MSQLSLIAPFNRKKILNERQWSAWHQLLVLQVFAPLRQFQCQYFYITVYIVLFKAISEFDREGWHHYCAIILQANNFMLSSVPHACFHTACKVGGEKFQAKEID